jgi:hypothetical protein
MCKSGGGSPPVPSGASTTFNSTVSPNPAAGSAYLDLMSRANTLSATPFNPAMLGTAAPLNALQTGAANQLYGLGINAANVGNQVSGYGNAISNVGLGAGQWDPAQVQAIMSPYTQNVVNTTQDWFNNQNAIQSNDLLSGAIRSGNAFGGDRAGVAQGIMAGQQQLAQAPVIANLYQQGYGQALDEFNKLQQLRLSGGQLAATGQQLGLAGQQFGLQGAGAAIGAGGLYQAQQQRELDIAQQNAMMQSAYPFQTLNWYGSILGGIGPLLGSTAAGSNNPPAPGGAGLRYGGIVRRARGGGLAGDDDYDEREPRTQLAGDVVPLPIHRLPGTVPAGVETGEMAGTRQGIVRPFFPYNAAGDARWQEWLRRKSERARGYDFGGGVSDDDDSRRDDEDRAPESKRESYASTSEASRLPETTATHPSTPNLGQGQLRTSARALPQPAFPSAASGGGQQQGGILSTLGNVAKTGSSLIDFGVKVAPYLAMLSDPKTKTDVQRIGRNDDGEPLYGFRYKGDPKSYPKVVGPMAHPMAWGGLVRRFANGGDIEDSNWSPERETGVAVGDNEPVPLPRARPNPPIPMSSPTTGRMTWFNPRPYAYTDPNTGTTWNDTGARSLREGPHASGLPISTPGFATAGNRALGHWYEVTTPDGQKQIIQKTDIGPPGVVDLNAAAASRAYANPNAVPSGQAQVRYIGKDLPPDVKPTSAPSSSAAGPTDPDAPTTRSSAERTGSMQPTLGNRTLPGFETPEKTLAQSLLSNPLTQMVGRYYSGTSPWGRVNLGRALIGTAEQQEAQRKQDVLDAKPQLMTMPNGEMGYRVGNQFLSLGMSSKETRDAAEATRKAEKHEREMQGDFITKKGLWGDERFGWNDQTKKYDVPLDTPAQTQQPATPKTEPAPAPAPPATPPAPAPQVRQSEAPAWQRAVGTDPRITAVPFHTPGDVSSIPPQLTEQVRPAASTQTAQAPAPQVAGPAAGQAPGSAEPIAEEEKDTAALVKLKGGFKTPLNWQVGTKNDPRMLEYFGMTPEDFDFRAARLAMGDTSVLTGSGASKQGTALRSALRARADQYWTDRGLGPERANAAVQEFMAQKAGARSLATQEGRITGALKSAMFTAPRVIETSANVDRTRFPDLNKIIIAGKTKVGDENVVRFGQAVETFVNNYARAMGGGNNVMTDNAREQAHLFLSTAYSKGQINAAIDQAMIEMDSELQGVRSAMGGYLGTEPQVRYQKGDVFKGPGQPQPGPQQAPQPGAQQRGGAGTGPVVIQGGHRYRQQPDGSYKAVD